MLREPCAQIAPRHLLSIGDLGRDGILAILDRAEELRTRPTDPHRFAGKVLGLLFFQPSTRTRFGFHAAMARLGGTAIELNETKHQPGMTRAESLSDTVRCVSAYCDAMVLRHFSVAAFEESLSGSAVPVINGGSGVEHHPTQTLIDLFAIRRHFGRIEGLRVGIVGDLESSRAMRSLLRALAYFPPRELRLMLPAGEAPGLLPEELTVKPAISHMLLAGDLDVLYMGGLPEGGDGIYPEEDRAPFRLTAERAASLEASALVLDPLPRIDEIDPAVDTIPQARYFEQSADGVYVRGAILDTFLCASR
jgi:aspartate carbamoyltransferase catalytic subunit